MTLFLIITLLFPNQEVNPPGTIRVGEFYVDKTEVLNIHWLEYIYYKKLELDSLEHSLILPDSSNIWYNLYNQRFEPITLISYEQAIDYCKWRSEVVSENLGIRIIYRLPDVLEWNTIAQKILSLDSTRVLKKIVKINKKLAHKNGEYFLLSREDVPKNIVYDLFWNVSEMTSTKGIAKGCNNYKQINLEDLTKDIQYDSINPFLGFRCIAELRNK